jgi:ADP-ribose pyrophosphatase YjhB (NUDIX family)
MTLRQRIAAGGITFKNEEVLLVRYPDGNGGSYLAAPGGGLEDHENIIQAIIRETKEETNIIVKPIRVVIIEDLTNNIIKMSKVWMICDYIEGEICETEESKKEGIIEAAWFNKNQLEKEIVYPEQLKKNEWNQLLSDKWQVECPPSREMQN